MTPTEYLATLTRLGLSFGEAAALLGVTRQQEWNYRTGVTPVPEDKQFKLRVAELLGIDAVRRLSASSPPR